MKFLVKSRPIILLVGLALMSFGLSFTGCSKESNPIAVPAEISSGFAASGSLNKGGKEPQLVDKKTVYPNEDQKLKVKGKNINGASFDVKENNVSQPTLMTLTKANEIKNTYTLEPLEMAMPNGVEIILEYRNSVLPYGVSEDDLQIFRNINGNYLPLDCSVNEHKNEVSATAFITGEFILGAYDSNGDLNIIEGEYGVRRDKLIKKNKGGIIALGFGSCVEIPKNALDEDTEIGIIATRESIQGTGDAKAFAFLPHGMVFNIPIKLVLAWREMGAEPVELYYDNPVTGEWELTSAGEWDYEQHTVTLEVPHFSRYAVAISR